ncbi:helix-turn-helix domain-containing protein [Streptomyces sp. NBC_00988]|uniref:helix-turn-helix domain-containing protein n=1 Tax=Streptomyces sp. NBC_00988 TaxID=2903704 RepID=UPI0038691BA0|nr:helix-turn-helix domain-containing protein [Streptomyces sp. NBC_00988]
MTANDRETAEEGATDDPVGAFAAWLTDLRRSKGNPSLDSIAREIRRRDPSATVVPSTISEILNGRRLPRWTTVEPIAHALGGERAVAECLRRWQAADTTRRTAAAGPGTPPDLPSSPPDTETEKDLPPRGRRRTSVGLAGLGCIAVATAALALYHSAHDRSGAPTAGAGTRSSTSAPATSSSQPSPSSPAASDSPVFTPGTTRLTAHTVRVSRTPDGLVTISVQSVNGNNIAGPATP